MIPVICPVFGHREEARACVEHLQQQSQPVNILVLDHCDDPATFTHVINEGLKRILQEGDEYVLIIHPDVHLQSLAVERLVSFMDQHPRCGIATGVIQLSSLPEGQAIGGGLDAFPYGAQRIAGLDKLHKNQKIHWAAWSCVILRTEMIRHIGLMDETMAMICSDSDYCFTARSRGWKIWRVGSALAFQQHGQSDPPESPRLERTKLQDMLTFGRKWLSGDLYRELAYEGNKCTPQWIQEAMQEFNWALQTIEDKPRNFSPQDTSPHAEQDLLQAAQHAHRNGQLQQAETYYRDILQIKPHHPMALHGMGLIAYQQQHPEDAVQFFVQAIEVDPSCAAYHLSLGLAYQQQQSHALASQALQEALRLNSDLVEAWQHRAVSLAALGHLDQAIEHLKQAGTLRSDIPHLHLELARLLGQQHRLSEAAVEYQAALRLQPDLAVAQYELAQVYRDLEDLPAAYRAVQQAVSLQPQHAGFHSLMAAILQDQGLLEEAMASCHKVIELMPQRAEATYNLACLYRDQGQLDEAIAYHQKAIDLDLEFAQAHWGQAVCCLLAGRYHEAWSKTPWRHRLYKPYPHTHSVPRWQGEDFQNRTLLVHCEQHLSDTLHWLRLLPQVKARGGTVVLAVWEPQGNLLTHTQGIDQCVSFTSKDPPAVHADLVASLWDLPGLLEATPETCPLIPALLHIPDEPRDRWQNLLGPDHNIGIAWTGINAYHSAALSAWIPLLQQIQATFINLQADPADLRERQLLDDLDVRRPFSDEPDLQILADLIGRLDLVIAVDSPILLLSALLERPTWGLIATSPDWRWMQTGDTSPWYPEVKLYRQQRPGQWDNVMEQLIGDLKKVIGDQ